MPSVKAAAQASKMLETLMCPTSRDCMKARPVPSVAVKRRPSNEDWTSSAQNQTEDDAEGGAWVPYQTTSVSREISSFRLHSSSEFTTAKRGGRPARGVK